MKTGVSILLFVLMGLMGCARSQFPRPEKAFRPVELPQITDSLGVENFTQALTAHFSYFQQTQCSRKTLTFGSFLVSCEKYMAALRELQAYVTRYPNSQALQEYLSNNFIALEAYGRDDWGNVLITSYYEPEISGSKRSTALYSQPLYARPDDLVFFDPKEFGYEGAVRRAQVVDKKIRPYPDREHIDDRVGAIKANILAWVDPIDAFFLQIQGSGRVTFEDGSQILLNYAEKNGRAYKALAQELKEVIKESRISKSVLISYLRSLDPDTLKKTLAKNPSYVFFVVGERPAVTSSGISAIAGRTIASDATYFPKGSLAFLSLKNRANIVMDRLVFDHDVGGAIKGTGRIDLFWGTGQEAGELAGEISNQGRLLYFIPK